MTDLRDILGHRAKVGVLVPFSNTIVQPEFEAMAPPGVTNHAARIPNPRRPMQDMEAYAALLSKGAVGTEDVIDRLKPAAPDLILLGHSIDSFRGGVAGANELQDRLSAHAGLPVLVPSLAMVAALEAIGRPRRLAVDRGHMVAGLEKGGEHGHREVGTAHEDQLEELYRESGFSFCA